MQIANGKFAMTCWDDLMELRAGVEAARKHLKRKREEIPICCSGSHEYRNKEDQDEEVPLE